MKLERKDWLLFWSPIAAAIIVSFAVVVAAMLISESITLSSRMMTLGLSRSLRDISVSSSRAGRLSRRAAEVPGKRVAEGVDAGTNPVQGNKDAKVSMVEFSDFQCPFTKKFYELTFPRIMEQYVKNGKVKFSWRDFPLKMHKQAENAAIAARCAGSQGKFWEMVDKLLGLEKIDDDSFQKCADDLGLNMKRFDACAADKKTLEAVRADKKQAVDAKIYSTPTFLINGRVVSGAYDFDVFRKIIDEELQKND